VGCRLLQGRLQCLLAVACEPDPVMLLEQLSQDLQALRTVVHDEDGSLFGQVHRIHAFSRYSATLCMSAELLSRSSAESKSKSLTAFSSATKSGPSAGLSRASSEDSTLIASPSLTRSSAASRASTSWSFFASTAWAAGRGRSGGKETSAASSCASTLLSDRSRAVISFAFSFPASIACSSLPASRSTAPAPIFPDTPFAVCAILSAVLRSPALRLARIDATVCDCPATNWRRSFMYSFWLPATRFSPPVVSRPSSTGIASPCAAGAARATACEVPLGLHHAPSVRYSASGSIGLVM